MGRLPFFAVVLALFGVGLAVLSVPNLGPAVRAARGDGVPGTFTARTVECVQHPGHEACTWRGEFRTASGVLTRPDTSLYGADRDYTAVGVRSPAVDVGRPTRVYSPGGSNEWIFTSLMLLAGLFLIAYSLRSARGRGNRPRSPVSLPA